MTTRFAAIAAVLLFGFSCKPVNKAPDAPVVVAGPASVCCGIVYLFTSTGSDPDGDSVGIRFEWGDGDTSYWNALMAGGDSVTMSHIWASPGSYDVRAQSRDASGLLSAWSSAYAVDVVETWTRDYGGTDQDDGYSVVQTSDGGFAVVGITKSYGAGKKDIWLVRVDSAGNQLWDRTFGWTDEEFGQSVAQTSDGGFVIAGATPGSPPGDYDVWLIRTDADGNHLWDRTFGGEDHQLGYSVVETSDGGFFVTGSALPSDGGGYDFWLMRTDAAGNCLWDRCIGGPDQDYGYSGAQTSDGGFIVTGTTESYGAGGNELRLVRADAAGNLLWDRTFGGSGNDGGWSVVQASDGGFVVAGYTCSYGAGRYDVWLMRTDASGNQLWDKTLGGTGDEVGYSIAQTSDGGFIVTGTTVSSGMFGCDVWLIRTDAMGNQLWERSVGSADIDDGGRSVAQTSDGGFIVAGYTGSLAGLRRQVWLIKTDAQGNTAP